MLAGCGSDDSGDDEAETTSPSPTSSPTSQKTPEEVTENAAPGEVVWKLPGDQSIAFGHGRVYRGERLQKWSRSRPARFEIAALSQQTGRTQWRTRFSVGSEQNLTSEYRITGFGLHPISKDRVAVQTATSTWEYGENILVHGVTSEEKQWQYPSSPQQLVSLEDSNARVLLLTFESGYVGLDAETGAERWQFEAVIGDEFMRLSDGSGYFYRKDENSVQQVNLSTGDIQWEWTAITRDGDTFVDSVTGAELVYLDHHSGSITAVSRRTGEVRWTYEKRQGGAQTEGIIAGGAVYVVAYDDHGGSTRADLLSLDRFDGTERWRVDLNERFGYRTIEDMTWQVMGETVLVWPDDRLLQAIGTTDGSTRWSTGSDGTIQSFRMPVSGTWLNNGELPDDPGTGSTDRIFLTRSAGVEALDAETGEQIWELTDLADRSESFHITYIDPSARWVLIRARSRTTDPKMATLTRVDGRTGETDWSFTRKGKFTTEHVTPEMVFVSEESRWSKEILALKNGG